MIAPVMVGMWLNHYRLTKALGSGGMGEVYLAEDTHLKRNVAIKILPQSLASDADRRERFEREAQAVAALNHPNIVTIHSVEHAGETHFMTMEFVEGQTLGALIQKGGLRIQRLRALATGIVDAVIAAHSRGVIHRDLKPANVMVTAGDRVKVLDFGVAKLRDDPLQAAAALPTRELTQEGRIVGTVAYMSPEQAQGQAVDERSDIFSLGVVLYELATGEQPFTGDTNLSVLSSVLRDTPKALSESNAHLPRDLARILRHCLAKDPDRRYQSAKDLRNDLDDLGEALSSGEVQPVSAGLGTRAAASKRWWLVAGVAAVLVAALAVWRSTGATPDRGGVPTLSHARLTQQAGIERSPSVSPDGTWVAYSAAGDIFLQSVSAQTAINLTKDSPAVENWPAFSPDGEMIAFQSDQDGGGIFVMGRTGDSVRRLTKMGAQPAWFPDGRTIVFSTVGSLGPENRTTRGQLWVVSTAGGEPRQLLAEDALQPRVSPTGKRIAFWSVPMDLASGRVWGDGPLNRDVWTVDSNGGQPVRVTTHEANDWNPVWAADGRWLYFLSNRSGSMNLWRVAIDETSGAVDGEPQPLTLPAAYVGDFSLSSDGKTAAYFSSIQTRNVGRIGFDTATGKTKGPAESVTTGANEFDYNDLTKDGKLLALTTSARGQEDVYVMPADGGSLRRLTNDFARDRGTRWFPDGRRIAFYSDRQGYATWFVDADGGGLRQGSTTAEPHSAFNPLPSRDGTLIATSDPTTREIAIYKASDFSRPLDVLPDFPERQVSYGRVEDWSPDGRTLAICGVGPAGGLWLYSFDTRSYRRITNSGFNAIWLNDGRRIIYSFGNRLMIVDVVSGATADVLAIDGESLAGPRMPADESRLYFMRTTVSGDIWLVRLSEPPK
jgi:serine/threonine protein kinase/WD40 repeat protein